MFLTNILFKKAKSNTMLGIDYCSFQHVDRSIQVMMESVVTGHTFNMVRERLADKLEVIRFDPFIQQMSIYRERKKIKSVK